MTESPPPSSIDWQTYTSFAAIVIALVSLGVSTLQWRTARAKLRLDYSPQRKVMYDAARLLIWRIQEKAGRIDASDLIEFNSKTHDADFVLNVEVSAYLEQLRRRAAKVAAAAETAAHISTEPTEVAKANAEKWDEIWWFTAQSDVLKNKFAQFLKLM